MPDVDRWENEGGAVKPKRPVSISSPPERYRTQLLRQAETGRKIAKTSATDRQRLQRQERHLKDQIGRIKSVGGL